MISQISPYFLHILGSRKAHGMLYSMEKSCLAKMMHGRRDDDAAERDASQARHGQF